MVGARTRRVEKSQVRPVLNPAVAEEGHRYALLAPVMRGEGVPEGDTDGSAHDPIRANKPNVEPGEVHRPSTAAGTPVALP